MIARFSIATALFLSACHDQDSSSDGASPAFRPDQVPLAGPPAPVKPPVPMGPAPGRWRFTSSPQGTAAGTADVSREDCLRNPIDLGEAHMRQAPPGSRCSDYAFRTEGASLIGTYACTLADGSKITIETTTSGNMMRAYTSTIISRPQLPAPNMPASTTTVIVAERTGDCEAPPPPLFLEGPTETASE